MERVVLLCVGKLKERFYIDAAAEYTKRLSRFCKLEIIELPEERLPEKRILLFYSAVLSCLCSELFLHCSRHRFVPYKNLFLLW